MQINPGIDKNASYSPWQWELNHTRCSCNSWIGSCLFWVYLALLYHGDKYVYGEAYWLLRFSFPNNHHKNIYINLHHTQEWLGCKEFLRVELVTQKKRVSYRCTYSANLGNNLICFTTTMLWVILICCIRFSNSQLPPQATLSDVV